MNPPMPFVSQVGGHQLHHHHQHHHLQQQQQQQHHINNGTWDDGSCWNHTATTPTMRPLAPATFPPVGENSFVSAGGPGKGPGLLAPLGSNGLPLPTRPRSSDQFRNEYLHNLTADCNVVYLPPGCSQNCEPRKDWGKVGGVFGKENYCYEKKFRGSTSQQVDLGQAAASGGAYLERFSRNCESDWEACLGSEGHSECGNSSSCSSTMPGRGRWRNEKTGGLWLSMGTPGAGDSRTSIQEARAIKEGYRLELERQIEAGRIRREEEMRRERDMNDHPLGSEYAKPKYYVPHKFATNAWPKPNLTTGPAKVEGLGFNSSGSPLEQIDGGQTRRRESSIPTAPPDLAIPHQVQAIHPIPQPVMPPGSWPGYPMGYGPVAQGPQLIPQPILPALIPPPQPMHAEPMRFGGGFAPQGNFWPQNPIGIQSNGRVESVLSLASNTAGPGRNSTPWPETHDGNFHLDGDAGEPADDTTIKQYTWQTSDQLPDPALKAMIYKHELKQQILQKQREQEERALRERQEDEKLEKKIKEYEERMRKEAVEEQHKMLRKLFRPVAPAVDDVQIFHKPLPREKREETALKESRVSETKQKSGRSGRIDYGRNVATSSPRIRPPPASPPIRLARTREQLEEGIRDKCNYDNSDSFNLRNFSSVPHSPFETAPETENNEEHLSLKTKLQDEIFEINTHRGEGDHPVGGKVGPLSDILHSLNQETIRMEKVLRRKMNFY